MDETNILEKKYGFKSYADSTLRGMTKDDLIEEIRVLEHNWAVAEMLVERQFCLIEKLNDNE